MDSRPPRSIPLDADWTVAPTARDVIDEVDAAVPGCVHTDLLEAGLIDDPYLDLNEAAMAGLFELDWRYRRPLRLEPAVHGERVDLVFEGIDTLGTIRLGGHELGRTANMHRSYRFDVTAQADGTERELEVELASVTAHVRAEAERLGARPSPYDTNYNLVRKMACSFGWDWGPDLRTAGLWRPVRVERWSVARAARVRPLVTVDDDGTGRVEVHVDVERSGRAPATGLTLAATVLGHRATVELAADDDTATVTLEVQDAPIWWPVGHGPQPLAELVVTLTDGNGPELADWRRRIGFRRIELDTAEDEHGSAFTLRVNGRPLFAKGFNWIPDDHFVSRVTADRVARRIDQAVAVGANLLRVWGGGIYESDEFYAACDERGVMVWQDFLLACAAYPQEQPLLGEIEAEARENVARLMPHPSLVLWNGGNENLWGFEDWGWKADLQDRTWGGRYALELFPALVAEIDPTRPYSANSPSSSIGPWHPNDPDRGTHHQWEVWNRIDYRHYHDEIPRFCSEFGYQAPPTWTTLTDFVHASDGGPLDEAPDPKNEPAFLSHQKAEDGNLKLDRGMAPHLGVPERFADWHWAAQLNQARAVAHAVEHYRSWWPRTAGALVWQLNDCWPVTSWSAVDGRERPKPLWFRLRRAFAPRLLAIVMRDDVPAVALTNDTDQEWSAELELRRETFEGAPRAREAVDVVVPGRSVVVVPVPDRLHEPVDAEAEALVARFDDLVTVHTFVDDVAARLDPSPLDVVAEPVSDGYRVRVRARSLALAVTLHPDRLDPDATVDDGMVDLPIGSSATFMVRTSAFLDPEELVGTPVLRTANDVSVPVLPRTRT